jgi:predicted transposase/invertase (TIGR01784 family)
MRFLNPKTDFAFKKIFGSPQSQEILIGLLNALLYDGKQLITEVEILDPYQAPQLKGMKDTFLDVKAQIQNNKTVIIEMQVLNVVGFEKRVLYNAAKAFSIQLDAGQAYAKLNPVIALTITDFPMFPDSGKLISHYQLKEKDELTTYSEDIELVFVELPKFKKNPQELVTLTDKWLYFLKQAETLDRIPSQLHHPPILSQAFEIAELANLSREELDLFERKQLFLQDSRNAILKARQQGEERKAQEIAMALLDVLDMDMISQKTGLTIAQIQKLQDKAGKL